MSFVRSYLAEQLKDPEFKKVWEAGEKEFQLRARLIELRKKRGLTQRDLARKLNTKQSVISRIENGEQNISLAYLNKIADALNAEVEIRFKPKAKRAIRRYKLVKHDEVHT
ncbi:helix-turn-helix domain-containing protein [Thermoactinomyces sp. CICC 10522]|uniref:helix-turn-helix domain-containing protein n=1 Tax=Thermoactinomyces sp. CICC 10522 TaxID=2767427 RepID=UPI0018DBDB4C|nr:helix-turn-helix transcriptional regulator [Thermoactinomyces sp. CICC 10522]MBH8605908.1 helix-turn-helix transcriptional regulator [Thermoactinomyces sp. CICC 10522]